MCRAMLVSHVSDHDPWSFRSSPLSWIFFGFQGCQQSRGSWVVVAKRPGSRGLSSRETWVFALRLNGANSNLRREERSKREEAGEERRGEEGKENRGKERRRRGKKEKGKRKEGKGKERGERREQRKKRRKERKGGEEKRERRGMRRERRKGGAKGEE